MVRSNSFIRHLSPLSHRFLLPGREQLVTSKAHAEVESQHATLNPGDSTSKPKGYHDICCRHRRSKCLHQ